MRSYFQNSCFMFHRGIQTPRNNKNTRPTAWCLHLFLGVWIPRWNTRSRFGNSTSHMAAIIILIEQLLNTKWSKKHQLKSNLIISLSISFINLLQNFRIDNANFVQSWWRQKLNKGQRLSQPLVTKPFYFSSIQIIIKSWHYLALVWKLVFWLFNMYIWISQLERACLNQTCSFQLWNSYIHVAVAVSLEIIGHMVNCCKRPIAQVWMGLLEIFEIRRAWRIVSKWAPSLHSLQGKMSKTPLP